MEATYALKGLQPLHAVTVDEVKAAEGGSITLCACIHKIKDMGSFSFVLLRTGSAVFQSVYEKAECPADLSGFSEGCYVRATGQVRKEPRAAHGVELRLQTLTLLSSPAESYPLHVSNRKLGCSLDTNLRHRTVALRNPAERLPFQISEGVCTAFRLFMLEQGFTEIHSPKITAMGAEGGANLFSLQYFGRDAYLSQSPQFYKQACVAFFDRVFEIGPVFRAEKHNSTRHLNEYVGLDFEMGYIDSMYDVMEMETAMLRYIMEYLKGHYAAQLTALGAELPIIGEIPAVTFRQTLKILGYSGKKADLDPEDEVRLCEYMKEKRGSDFVFVTHFPSAKRPFYVMDDPENPKQAFSFDLLFRGLEITTGGQRIHDYAAQVEKLKRMNMDPEEFSTYLSIHRYGMPPHGGLGIGLERLVQKLLGLDNIRRASLFPRDVNHLEP